MDRNNVIAAVTPKTLRSAEAIHAVDFPEDALTRIAPAIAAQREAIEAVRAVPRPLDLQPAARFDPRMPGRVYPPQQNVVRPAGDAVPPMPKAEVDIAYASVTQQANWLRTGQITGARLTDIYLERITRIDPSLHAYITVTADIARKQAKERDAELAVGKSRGPLHGIPYALKDVIDTGGIATTYGSSLYKDRIPATDSTIAKMLQNAGGVLLGKVATAELAYGATWFGGMVRNPWNTAEPSGGSSAGSGSAVAAALCSFAIGTDSLGSILNPCDRCGVTGLRPTFGRVPVHGCMPLTPSLERIGPICRQVEDAALILAVINGADLTSIGSVDFGFAYDAGIDLNTIKVGYSPAWFSSVGFSGRGRASDDVGGQVPASPGHLAGLEAMRTSGVELVEMHLPDLPFASLLQSLYVESAAVFEELTLSGQDARLIPPWPDLWRQARFLSAVDYYQIERFRRQVMVAMDELFAQVDMLFAPTYGSFDLLMVTNFTGHPGLTFRSGFSDIATRDIGSTPIDPQGPKHRVTSNVSLHGRLYEEGKILAVAHALEKRLDVWHVQPPIG
ncbi:MAG: Amidase [Bradyrhizobium sp.]|nr:Amidase [Bradyrhizobium sp.]